MSDPADDSAALHLPRFWEFEAPPGWQRIDLISDLHLAEDRPRTFAAFADHLRHTSADVVFLLGDIFDVWVGDDALDEDGFERRCLELLADAASRLALGVMVGNRDFLLGERMRKACGAMALPDPTVLLAFGGRTLLSHGDALCLDDTVYQQFRAEVRSQAWQRGFLALPLADRRLRAQAIRRESERRKRAAARADWVDVDPASTVRWMHEAGASTLIHGHTHCPGSEPVAPGFIRHVLTDWELDDRSQPPRAEVLRLFAGGIERVAPARPR